MKDARGSAAFKLRLSTQELSELLIAIAEQRDTILSRTHTFAVLNPEILTTETTDRL